MDGVSRCRTCHQAIWWAQTGSGRRIPIDPEPVPDGNVVVEHPGDHGEAMVTVLGRPEEQQLYADVGPRYQSHFATCPQAAQHRRKP